MIVSLKEYAEIHGIKHCTVRGYVKRGQLTVISRDGRYTYVDSNELPSTRSYLVKYGKQPALSNVYRQMRARCYNKNNPRYKNYGGRGICVCDEWNESPAAFIGWALENGFKEGLTIDRIDNDGNYEPDNCQWITRSENSKKSIENRREKYKDDLYHY